MDAYVQHIVDTLWLTTHPKMLEDVDEMPRLPWIPKPEPEARELTDEDFYIPWRDSDD